MSPDRTCPQCGGPQLAGHPGGALEVQHTAMCELLAAEDATRAADRDRADRLGRERFARPTTITEAALLTAFGIPAHPSTHVDYLTRGVRHRSWSK